MFKRFVRNMAGLYIVRTTVGSRKDAEKLAQRLVDERVAACVHFTEISAVYRWQGQRRQETEFMVEARTSLGGRAALAGAMLAGHPYEVPLVEGWPVNMVPSTYAGWAKDQIK